MTPRTFTDTLSIELTGHKGYGAEIECEVSFTRTPVVPARTSGPAEDCHPEEGGETEIVSVTPFRMQTGNPSGWTPEYLDCPPWLADLLIECIDPDELECGEDDDG
jgi:hypothetical protein